MAMTPAPGSAGAFRPARAPSPLFALGMLGIFLGERVMDVGSPRTLTTVIGLCLVLAAVAVRVVRMTTGSLAHRAPERLLLVLYLGGLLAVGLYFLNSDLLVSVTGRMLEQSSPRLSGAIAALWPALWLCAALPVVFVELSLATMARGPVLELGRLRAALMAALGIALALVFSFAISYVANERDVKADFSYFRTARPGESTKKVVQVLDKPVEVHLFFPPANEVREEVESYFAELGRQSKMLQVHHWDHALHPAKAKELGVSGNGIIVIGRDTLREQIGLSLALEGARSALRSLDQDVHRRLLGVTRKQRIAYFTAGHDERGAAAANDTDRRATVRTLRTVLTDQGFEPRDLGLAQGLGSEVPADASVVLILGPRQPFTNEETSALIRYLDKNGRLLIALDPDAGQTMPELLGALSLKYNTVTLANDRLYLARTYQDSDKINIGTASYSSHVSVSTNSRMGQRSPLLLMGAGYLEKNEKGAVGIVNVDFTVHADTSTWADKDGNFRQDEGSEMRAAYELAAAVSKRNASALHPEEEARAVVLADSDCLTDGVIQNRGNAYLALDTIRWLGGEERITGTITSEEDVSVIHTRKQDMVWFYSSVFLAPASVLGLGFFMTRRRRGPRKGGGKGKVGPGTEPPSAGPGSGASPASPPPGNAPSSSEVSR